MYTVSLFQVSEADEVHRTRIASLNQQLTRLEAEASQHQTVLDATVLQNKQELVKLQQDKAMLEVKLQKKEKEVIEARNKADQA